jgi:hypothetical protein
MEIFKVLPFELQFKIYNRVKKERYMNKKYMDQRYQKELVDEQFKMYRNVFYKYRDDWITVLFFTLRFEKNLGSQGWND